MLQDSLYCLFLKQHSPPPKSNTAHLFHVGPASPYAQVPGGGGGGGAAVLSGALALTQTWLVDAFTLPSGSRMTQGDILDLGLILRTDLFSDLSQTVLFLLQGSGVQFWLGLCPSKLSPYFHLSVNYCPHFPKALLTSQTLDKLLVPNFCHIQWGTVSH